MTEQRQPGPTRMVTLQTKENAASSEEILKARSMNYWLEKISPEDVALLWKGLADSVKAANPPISWVRMANGTTIGMVKSQDAIVCIPQCGYAKNGTNFST